MSIKDAVDYIRSAIQHNKIKSHIEIAYQTGLSSEVVAYFAKNEDRMKQILNEIIEAELTNQTPREFSQAEAAALYTYLMSLTPE